MKKLALIFSLFSLSTGYINTAETTTNNPSFSSTWLKALKYKIQSPLYWFFGSDLQKTRSNMVLHDHAHRREKEKQVAKNRLLLKLNLAYQNYIFLLLN